MGLCLRKVNKSRSCKFFFHFTDFLEIYYSKESVLSHNSFVYLNKIITLLLCIIIRRPKVIYIPKQSQNYAKYIYFYQYDIVRISYNFQVIFFPSLPELFIFLKSFLYLSLDQTV